MTGKLPQLNLRIPEAHHELVRQIAARLRESSAESFATSLSAFLGDAAPPVPVSSTELAERVAVLADELSRLSSGLAELERWRQSFFPVSGSTPEPQAAPELGPKRRNDPIPLELLELADRVHKDGRTWASVALLVSSKLGYEVTANGVRNAVKDRLKG